MFKNAYQKGFLTIFFSGGSQPLAIWGLNIRNGRTRRVNDETVRTLAFEIAGTNVATAYISCPADPKASLGITLPFLIMQIKNMKRYFTFEVQILDDQNIKRRFRFSNYQSCSKVRPFACSMPIGLTEGWNQLNINLPNFTRRAYGTNYLETVRMQVHANCRIRRIYFTDKLYSDNELPNAYRMYHQVKS